MKHKIGIIGCGLIGWKRAMSLKKNQIIGCYDTNINNAKKFAKFFGCINFRKVDFIINNKDINTVLICTPHNSLNHLANNNIKKNKHVFIEKPGAKDLKSLIDVKRVSKSNPNSKVHVGYNHRYHPSIIMAKKIIEKKKIGKIMYIRARYGHGARLNYEKEWRMKRKISGGGELIDQGSHLIDLSRLFLGNLKLKFSRLNNFFWKNKDKVEDNAFLVLENKNGNLSFLHCSCTEWKNKFSFEIFGKLGKLEISGLGGSYGKETLTFYKMKKKMGKPTVYKWSFPSVDNSWKDELNDFFEKIKRNKKIVSNLDNAIENMKLIHESYSIYK